MMKIQKSLSTLLNSNEYLALKNKGDIYTPRFIQIRYNPKDKIDPFIHSLYTGKYFNPEEVSNCKGWEDVKLKLQLLKFSINNLTEEIEVYVCPLYISDIKNKIEAVGLKVDSKYIYFSIDKNGNILEYYKYKSQLKEFRYIVGNKDPVAEYYHVGFSELKDFADTLKNLLKEIEDLINTEAGIVLSNKGGYICVYVYLK